MLKREESKYEKELSERISLIPTKKIAVEFAIACAKRSLKIWEKSYPNDNSPRKAIEAAENWLNNPSKSAAATYAADAADAARAAVRAAYATLCVSSFLQQNECTYAYAAAHSAAYAADAAAAFAADAAAYAAAHSAAHSAYAAYLSEMKWQIKKLKTIMKSE